MKVCFISLGCSKNLVVTEEVMGLFLKHNYEIVNDDYSDIVIINTCGFIEAAKTEAIDTILEVIDYKPAYLIVIGCLVQRYKEELMKLLPEVDLFLSIKDYPNLWEQIDNLINNNHNKDFLSYKNRVITTGYKTAYLKISEGCSNGCTYCAIPLIQGRLVSRPFDSIIDEAHKLALDGYEEIIVIAQDTTKYGLDLYKKPRLTELLAEISKIDGIKWIRFLYSYPEGIDDSLIELVKNNPKICKYIDMPIQHISDSVLARMHRKTDAKTIKNLIIKLRKEIPNIIIRTTLITGFPGETEEDFNSLHEFVKDYKIDRLGCFAYSKEEGTIASRMDNQLPSKIKKTRKNKIMSLQQNISKSIMESKIGQTYEVLLTNVTDDSKYFIGRSYMDVPDEDGVIFVEYNNRYMINEFVNVEITDSYEYDLVGKIKDS